MHYYSFVRLMRAIAGGFRCSSFLITSYIVSLALCSIGLLLVVELTRYFLDEVLFQKNNRALILFSLSFLPNLIFLNIAVCVQRYLEKVTGGEIIFDMQSRVYRHVLHYDPDHLLGDCSNLADSVNEIRTFVVGLVELFMQMTKCIILILPLMSLIFYHSLFLGFYSLIFLFLILFPLAKRSRISAASADVSEVLSNYPGKFDEVYVSTLMRRHDLNNNIENKIVKDIFSLRRRIHKNNFTSNVAVAALLSLFTSLFFFFGGTQVIDSTITLGQLLSSFIVLVICLSTLNELSSLRFDFIKRAKKISDIIADLDLSYTPKKDVKAPALVIERGEIKFDNVSYVVGEISILNKINFTIYTNKIVTLCVWDKSVKKAIIDLLLGFSDSYSGSITIDGHDIRDIDPRLLRSVVGLVSQDIFIFDDTIYANIAYATSSIGADRKKVISVAKLAGIHDSIIDLPMGYNTILGDGGLQLNADQRFGMSIARAILKDAPTLILHDFAADIVRHKINMALAYLMKSKTNLLITDELANIVNPDWIYIVDNGAVVEEGTHSQLITLGGVYAGLYSRSIGGFKNFH